MTAYCYCGAPILNGHHCENGHTQVRAVMPLPTTEAPG